VPQDNGLLSGLPHLLSWIVATAAPFATDLAISRGVFGITAARKMNVTIALLGPDDRDPDAGVAPALRAEAVEPLAERLAAAGWAVDGPHDGGHERRIEVRDPSGNPLVVYAPLPG